MRCTQPSEQDVLHDLMERRHSCRAFLRSPVPRSTIESILAAAQSTASWCNAQPWHIHLVGGKPLENLTVALLARAESGAEPNPELEWPREYRGVYQDRKRACGWALYEAVGVARGDRVGSLRDRPTRIFGFSVRPTCSC